MKIGIITIFDPTPNYGNRLQNYAVYQVLSNIGIEAETLYVEPQIVSRKNDIKKFIHKITNYRLAKERSYWKYTYIKMKRFQSFNNRYIPHRQINTFSNLSNQYDYFMVGSDQVWNPSWYHEHTMKKDAFLLTFAKDHQKLCFSPSFGVSQLPEEWEITFKEALQSFKKISVREEAGAHIIKQLTGKDAEVLIDPTLMLSKSDWTKIEARPKHIDFKKEYILSFFIGEKAKEHENYIKKVAEEYNLCIYNLMDYSQPELYIADPAEFIYLIHHAKIIFTDSFHACVFSFIFGKPFQVFPRNGAEKNMMSRIETLLNKFSLQRKLYDSSIKNVLFECDYAKGYSLIEKEQQKVNNFLRKSLFS